jgi:serine/threonine protein kinase
MPGQILGDRYEVEKQLGKRSGRWTLLARDLTTDTPVILKLLFIDEEMHQDDLKLFTREVQTLQTLDHPNTPNYIGYFEIDLAQEGKALALIQSYIEGYSLDHYLKRGRLLSQSEAIWIAIAALNILTYLHHHDPPIIHRDIKPGNIMLSKQPEETGPRVSLVDFGSVKSFTVSDATSFTLVGTDGFMPPEQMGRRAVKASDLYGLGMSLITATSGLEPAQLPHRGLKVDLEQVKFTPPLSSSFMAWLQQMIEPDLDRRFSSAEEALQALDQVS